MDSTESLEEREILLDVDVPVVEDLVAELENFILIARLGIVDDALEIIHEVLWTHLDQFIIFAEISAFLVVHQQFAELQYVMEELELRNIKYDEPEEIFFTTLLQHINRIVNSGSSLSELGFLRYEIIVLITDLKTYKSPTKVLILEILFQIAYRYNVLNLSNHIMLGLHASNLLRLDFVWDLTRMICIIFPESAPDVPPPSMGDYQIWDAKLKHALDTRRRGAADVSAGLELALCEMIRITLSTGRSFQKKMRAPLDEVEEVHRLHEVLFKHLENPLPRGIYIDFWRKMHSPSGALSPSSYQVTTMRECSSNFFGIDFSGAISVKPLHQAATTLRSSSHEADFRKDSSYADLHTLLSAESKYLNSFVSFDEAIASDQRCVYQSRSDVGLVGRCKVAVHQRIISVTRTQLDLKEITIRYMWELALHSLCDRHRTLFRATKLPWRIALRWLQEVETFRMNKDSSVPPHRSAESSQKVGETSSRYTEHRSSTEHFDVFKLISNAPSPPESSPEVAGEMVHSESVALLGSDLAMSGGNKQMMVRSQSPSPQSPGGATDRPDIFKMNPDYVLRLLAESLTYLVKVNGDVAPPATIEDALAQDSKVGPQSKSSISQVSDESFASLNFGRPSAWTQHDSLLRRFYSKRPPPISMHDYLSRIHKYCPMSTAVYLAAFHYIVSLTVHGNRFRITARNSHRLTLTALRVAMKAHEDLSWPHARFAKVCGISEAELTRLEISFCFLIDFALHVNGPLLARQVLLLFGLRDTVKVPLKEQHTEVRNLVEVPVKKQHKDTRGDTRPDTLIAKDREAVGSGKQPELLLSSRTKVA